MHELCCLCGVAQHELPPCKSILLEHFNTTYPKVVEAAERHRAANAQRLAAAGRSSPDSSWMPCTERPYQGAAITRHRARRAYGRRRRPGV